MQKKKSNPTEPEDEMPSSNSENSIEYEKYIKKLELQRLVLNKIVNHDLNQTATDTSNSESLNSI